MGLMKNIHVRRMFSAAMTGPEYAAERQIVKRLLAGMDTVSEPDEPEPVAKSSQMDLFQPPDGCPF